MDYISLIISLAALFFSIYTYLKYDKPLKDQQKLLNQYNLLKIIKEERVNEVQKKKAMICGEVQTNSGSYKLRVTNKGQCRARRIRIEGLTVKGIEVTNKFIIPYPELCSSEHFTIPFIKYMDAPDILHIKFIWNDDFEYNNENYQTLQL